MRNALGREIPRRIDGYRAVEPFTGAFDKLGTVTKTSVRMNSAVPGKEKVLADLRAALEACELKDGATVSFHHHLRNGDRVLNSVLHEIASMGRKDVKVAASSLFPVHEPLVEHIRGRIVTGISTSYMVGGVAEAVSRGALATPAIMHTHGGRARAIEAGDLHIDIAFIAAPTADVYGNVNGVHGRSACGTLGYAMVDALCADRVVAVTDHLVAYPACPIDIGQDHVDFVVPIADAAAGAKLAIVTTRLVAGGHPKIVDRVRTVTTPGETVDAVVTEEGTAINPGRADLRDRLQAAGIPVIAIEDLKEIAQRRVGRATPMPAGERTIAVVEYRDGTVIDVVGQCGSQPVR